MTKENQKTPEQLTAEAQAAAAKKAADALAAQQAEDSAPTGAGEYPLWLYKDGDQTKEGVVVNDRAEERAAKEYTRLGAKKGK